MLQELHSKLIAARNFELVAKFWDWYILLRISGVNGRLSCYWDHDQDCLGYNQGFTVIKGLCASGQQREIMVD